MLRKSLSLMLVAAALFAGLSLPSHADTNQYVTQSGSTTQDNLNFMSVYVNASLYTYTDPAIPAQITGSISLSGNNGAFNMNAGATSLKTLVFGKTTYNGKSVSTVNITTNVFPYFNLTTNKKTLAYMKLTILQSGKGLLSFQIFDAATSVVIAATASLDGQAASYTLSSGSTNIRL